MHRLLQTAALDGLKRRYKELGVPLPKTVVTDNCCQVRSSIHQALPDAEVFWHFVIRYVSLQANIDALYRYMFTVIGGTHNPHHLEVGKDITHAIIRTSASPCTPSTYWTQEEQETRLIAAYEKWATGGGVWSAASVDVSIQFLIVL